MPPTHAAKIHTILVQRLDAGVEEYFHDLVHATKHFGGSLALIIAGFEAHDANVFRAEALHAGNGALHFRECHVERVGDLLRPIHDRRAEAVNLKAGCIEFVDGLFESLFRQVVKIRCGKSRDLHRAHFDRFPAEFLHGLNLPGQDARGFVADTHQFHNYLRNEFAKSSADTATTFFSIFDSAINWFSLRSQAALSIGKSSVPPSSDE